MPSTPIYALRYQSLSDPPNGAGLGQDLAEDVEAELQRIDAAVAARPAIATGVVNAVFNNQLNVSVTANFPAGRFSAAPTIACQVVTGSGAAIRATVLVTAISATSATIRVDKDVAVTGTIPVHWIAIKE